MTDSAAATSPTCYSPTTIFQLNDTKCKYLIHTSASLVSYPFTATEETFAANLHTYGASINVQSDWCQVCNSPNTHSERTGQKYQKLRTSHFSHVACTPKQFASNISLWLHFFHHKSHVKAKRITWCSLFTVQGCLAAESRAFMPNTRHQDTRHIKSEIIVWSFRVFMILLFAISSVPRSTHFMHSPHLAERSSSHNSRTNGLILSSRHVPRIDWRKAEAKKKFAREISMRIHSDSDYLYLWMVASHRFVCVRRMTFYRLCET